MHYNKITEILFWAEQQYLYSCFFNNLKIEKVILRIKKAKNDTHLTNTRHFMYSLCSYFSLS